MFEKHTQFLRIRRAKGYSQGGIKKKLGLKSQTSLSNYEKGKTKRNRLMVLQLIEVYELPAYVANILKKENPSEPELRILERYITKLEK